MLMRTPDNILVKRAWALSLEEMILSVPDYGGSTIFCQISGKTELKPYIIESTPGAEPKFSR